MEAGKTPRKAQASVTTDLSKRCISYSVVKYSSQGTVVLSKRVLEYPPQSTAVISKRIPEYFT